MSGVPAAHPIPGAMRNAMPETHGKFGSLQRDYEKKTIFGEFGAKAVKIRADSADSFP